MLPAIARLRAGCPKSFLMMTHIPAAAHVTKIYATPRDLALLSRFIPVKGVAGLPL
jgi:hypothetical protein